MSDPNSIQSPAPELMKPRSGCVGRKGRGRPKVKGSIPKAAEFLAARGYTMREIAEAIGVSLSTVEQWVATGGNFSRALNRGRATADFRVEHALLERAIGTSVPDSYVATGDAKHLL